MVCWDHELSICKGQPMLWGWDILFLVYCVHSSPKQKCLSLSNWHWSLFNASSELLGKSSTAPLPSDIPHSELPDQFCDFFSSKRDHICDNLASYSCEPLTFSVFDGQLLSQFEPVTKTLRVVILMSLTKSCMLDPIPISITKQCLNDLVLLITVIVNAYLSTCIVPPQFKQAIVAPLLKELGLDSNDINKTKTQHWQKTQKTKTIKNKDHSLLSFNFIQSDFNIQICDKV